MLRINYAVFMFFDMQEDDLVPTPSNRILMCMYYIIL